MKSLRTFFLLVPVILGMVCSCVKDSTLLYTTYAIGNVSSGVFTSDEGVEYNVVSQACPGQLDTMKRVLLYSDILREHPGKKNVFDVRLRGMAPVIIKNAVIKSQDFDDTIIGHDPISVDRGWYSSEYLNVMFSFYFKKDSPTKHSVNLIFDDENSTDEMLVFELRHNGFSETKDQLPDYMATELVSGIFSFPIRDFIPKGRDKVDIILNWKWHFDESDSSDIRDFSSKGVITN